jgi:hypothetical protein
MTGAIAALSEAALTTVLPEVVIAALGVVTAVAVARALSSPSATRHRTLQALHLSLPTNPGTPRRGRQTPPGAAPVGAPRPGPMGSPPQRNGTSRLLGHLRARASRRALHAALPETADLLVVSMNAGLNLVLALQRTARHAPEPMRSELERVNHEIALGRPLREAVEGLASRTGSDEIRALASILTGGDRFGVRVAESVEQWADDLWMRHRHELEAEARRAPVKILFPLVFLILPAFLLTTVVPLLLSTLHMLGHDP